MTNKKVLPLIFATLVIFSTMVTVVSPAFSASMYSDYKYSVNTDNTITIDAYKGSSAKPDIPQKIQGKTVKTIGDYAFSGNLKVKEINIPDGVTTIGEGAFFNCTELNKVTMSETVKTVDNAAFFGCTRLDKLSLSDSIEYLGEGSFYYCDSLKTIELPANLTKTGEYIFGYCRGLENVTINDKLTTISPQSFISCSALKSVKLHNNLKEIGRKAFMSCNALADITIPESLDKINDDAFNGCYEFKVDNFKGSYLGSRALSGCKTSGIKLSENLSYIGYEAFADSVMESMFIPASDINMADGAFVHANISSYTVSDDNPYFTVKDGVLYSKDMTVLVSYPSFKEAETFTLPESVKTISNYAFSNSGKLKEIIFNNKLEKIGDYAFNGVVEVKTFDIPKTVNEIGTGAFSDCVSMTSFKVPEGINTIKSNTFESCSALEKIEIPESVEIIEDYAFKNCTGFTSFEITKGINKLTALAFKGCYELKSFEVNNSNPYFSKDNQCIVSKDKSTIVAYPNALTTDNFKVADCVTKIEAYAFANNENIKEMYLTKNIKSIGEYGLGFCMSTGNGAPDRIADFEAYIAESCEAYEFAKKADLAVFKAKPVQKETEIKLNAGDKYNFLIDNTFAETVVYSVSDHKVASVDEKGCITALNKGETTVIATVGTRNFVLKLEVNGTGTTANNNEYGYDLSNYRALTKDTYEQWEKDYSKFNSHVSMNPLSNPNIVCYSGSEYVPIVATQTGNFSRTEATYGEDIGQYYYISDGLSMELGRHKLNENLILYSGTNNVTNFTGTSSSLKDMKNTIGKTITDKAVISTSIDHGVAASFGTGSYHTVLEIYAPANATKGAFIKSFSQYPCEQEILLDCNQSYKVLDAGVRTKNVTDFSGNTEELTERYIKLIVVDNDSEN